MKLKFTLALVFTFYFSLQLKAQWTNDTLMNTVVWDQNLLEEATPLQATTTDGKTFVSWFGQNQNGSYNMMLQLLDINGNKLWATSGLVVSSNPQTTSLSRYDLKIDNADNAIVAFQDIRSGDLSTYVYKIDTSQNFLWGANGIALHDSGANYEVAPSIGILSNNDVVVAWNASDASNSRKVPFQKISSSGTVAWTQPNHIGTAGNKYTRPVVVGMNNQEFAIVYIQETGSFPGITSLIKCMLYDATGANIWGSPVQVSSYSTTFVFVPKVAKDNSGGLFVGFDCGTPGNPSLNDVFVQHILTSGVVSWGTNGNEVSSLAGNNKNLAKITYRITDDHLYALMKVLDGGQSMAGVYAQSFDILGNKLFTSNGAMLLPLSSPSYREPFSWCDAGDGFIAAYSEGGVVNQFVKAVKMDYSGTLLWNGNAVMICAVASSKLNVSVGEFMNNQAVVVWEDTRIDRGIYAQNIGKNGGLGLSTGINQNFYLNNVNLFPNPVNGVSTLSFTTKTPSQVKIAVVDILGNELSTVFDGSLDAGMHSFKIEKKKLTRGIYFLRVGEVNLKMIME